MPSDTLLPTGITEQGLDVGGRFVGGSIESGKQVRTSAINTGKEFADQGCGVLEQSAGAFNDCMSKSVDAAQKAGTFESSLPWRKGFSGPGGD